jgi:hypothetical protein
MYRLLVDSYLVNHTSRPEQLSRSHPNSIKASVNAALRILIEGLDQLAILP